MKFLSSQFITAGLLACALGAVGAIAETATTPLRVELSGLQDVEGDLYIAVYDSDDNWLGDETVMEKQVVIAESREGQLVTTVLELPPGEYALSIFYDSNSNGELDTNFIGIPKEPVAISNNARPKFGPPKYKDAVFSLGEEPLTQSISMEKI
jgi:uncharacterized protein (DUF2141 family)